MTKEELGQKIKLKYPQYSQLDNNILADKVIAKYPIYQNQITEQDNFRFSAGGFQGIKQGFDVLKGVGKGALSTIRGAGQLGERILQQPLKAVGAKFPERTGAEKLIPEKVVTPETIAQKVGFFTEQLAEFIAPIPGTKTSKIPFISKVIKDAVDFGARTAIQEGKIDKEAGIAAGIGGVAPVVGKVFKGIKGAVTETGKSVLKATTSVPEKAIERAGRFSGEVKAGFKKDVTATTIRDEAMEAVKIVKQAGRKAFGEGMKSLKKLTPTYKPAREITGKFANTKSRFKEVLEDKTKGLPSVFRNFAVSTEQGGNRLNFDKLNSSITKSVEQKQLQQMLDTIKRQTDFSAQGIERVAERLNALRKFQEGAITRTSVMAGKITNIYKEAIKKVIPELGKVRTELSQNKSILDGVEAVLNASKGNNVKAIKSSVNKLTNLFREDNDIYIDTLIALEKASGKRFLSKLAGTEFQRISPGILRTSLAVGGIGAATYFNPLVLLLLPIFSPRAVGGIITNVAKARELIKPLLEIGLDRVTPATINQIIRELIGE